MRERSSTSMQIFTACGLFAAISLAAPAARARCASSSLRITPPSKAKSVPANVEVLFVAYGHMREKVADLLDGSHFVSGKDRVPLTVERLAQSKRSYRNVYVRLIPRRPLKVKRWYRLVLAKTSPPPDVKTWLRRIRGYHFKTGTADKRAPGKPTLVSKGYSLRRLGCGPAEQISLEVSDLRDGRLPAGKLGLLLEVEEKSVKGRRSFEIRLAPPYSAGHTRLGHGMCAGNYKLVKEAVYRIRVRAVDWAGNRSKPSKPVTVRAR